MGAGKGHAPLLQKKKSHSAKNWRSGRRNNTRSACFPGSWGFPSMVFVFCVLRAHSPRTSSYTNQLLYNLFLFPIFTKNYLVYLKSVVLFTPRSASDVSVKRGATQRARSLAYLNQNSTSTGLSSLQQERRVKVWIQFCIVYSNQQERLISHGPGLGDPTLSTLNPEASITW